jgi:hypothetical protein
VSSAEVINDFSATFAAARAFGLDDEEIWQTVNDVYERVPNEITEASLEELTCALANRIEQTRGFTDWTFGAGSP